MGRVAVERNERKGASPWPETERDPLSATRDHTHVRGRDVSAAVTTGARFGLRKPMMQPPWTLTVPSPQNCARL